MNISVESIYFVSDDFLEKVSDPCLKINYKTTKRPHYFAFQDMFPITDRYIDGQYIRGSQPVYLANPKLVQELEKTARSCLPGRQLLSCRGASISLCDGIILSQNIYSCPSGENCELFRAVPALV